MITTALDLIKFLEKYPQTTPVLISGCDETGCGSWNNIENLGDDVDDKGVKVIIINGGTF